MTLNQLKYFIEVCRWGNNITKAGEELHISQPSISNAIKDLENEFGVALFRRENGRLHITPEGEHFLSEANLLIKKAEELSLTMKSSGIQKKKISIGLTPMVGAFIFPDVCKRFMEVYPDTRFEISEQGAIETHELLRNGKIDIAININSAVDTTQFRSKRLLQSQYCLCVNQAHPLAAADAVSVNDLADTDLCLLSGHTYHTDVIFRRFSKNGIEPNVVMRSNQFHTLVHTVQRGAAASFFLQEVRNFYPAIAAIPFKEPLAADICVFWRREMSEFQRINDFIRFIQEEY